MKAALLSGVRDFRVGTVAAPEIAAGTDVLVRIKATGVCGSDVHYFNDGRIGHQVVRFPAVIGHETAGVVEDVGVAVSRVGRGQRIAIDPAVFCGHCDQCRAGRENTCRSLRFLGNPMELGGSLCEYVVLPETCCHPKPDSMSFEQAVLAEPLAIAGSTGSRGNPPTTRRSSPGWRG